MASLRPVSSFDTHEVFNQPPPLEDINLFTSDLALAQAVRNAGGEGHRQRLAAMGARAGSQEVEVLLGDPHRAAAGPSEGGERNGIERGFERE